MGAALLGHSATHVYDPDSGEWINQTVKRVAELLAEFQHDLRLAWIPQSERIDGQDKPYGVMHFPEGKEPYMIAVMSEEEVTSGNLIANLWCMREDTKDLANILEARERVAKALKDKENEELRHQKYEEHYWLLRTNKNRVQLGRNDYIS